MKAGHAIAVGILAILATTVAACTAAPHVVKRSSVTVAVEDPFTSLNPQTQYGATAVNQEVAYSASSQFFYYDNDSRLHADPSFGTVHQVGKSPLQVKYEIKSGVRWSDGVRVSGADLLLAWAANSGALNTPGFDARRYRTDDGRLRSSLPKSVVWFDGRIGGGLRYASTLPTLGTDHRSMTLHYSDFYVDWRTALEVGLPAHVVAEKAFGLTSASKADAALIAAIKTNDTSRLAALSRVWNSAFNVTRRTMDPTLLVSDGPYAISSIEADGSVTMVANKQYTGSHRPRVQTVTARVVSGAKAQVAALDSGKVDVITPIATAGTARALVNLKKITIASGYDAAFEQLDLQFAHSKSGTFDSETLRQAFLEAVPRAKIVSQLAGSIQADTMSRASFMLFPGAEGYPTAVADNGSQKYATIDLKGAAALVKASRVRHPTVCILYDPANSIRVAEFALIKASEKQAGFTVTDCSTGDWASRLGKRGAYDASISGWRSTSSAITAASPRVRSGDLGENYNFYASPVTDKLLDTLAHTTGAAQQTAVLTNIDRQLFADAYGLPLFQIPSLTAFRTTVTGIRRSPFAPGVFWNIWEWRPTR